MPELQGLAKMLLGIGGFLVLLGLLLLYGGRFLPLGRLPGDILYKKGNFTFYFPLATGILISIVLTLLFNLLGRR
jgi:hypothetical protein